MQSSVGALRRLPVLLIAQQARAAGAQAAATARLLSTGTHDQQNASSSSGRPSVVVTAAALLGAGAAATASGHVGATAADAPVPIQASSDPYARPAEAHTLPARVTLYQYEVCPYCCKVRAFLDYHKLPYTIVEVNPLTKGELAWSSYKKVPVVQLDDEVVVDSSAIMSRLATDVAAAAATSSSNRSAAVSPAAAASTSQPAAASVKKGWSLFGGSSSSDAGAGSKDQAAAGALSPKSGSGSASGSAVSLEDEVRWRKWVDEKLVKVLTANIYRNWDESVETFKYIADQTGWSWGTRAVARWSGAVMMWQIGKRMPAKYGIEGDLRVALYDVANDFVDNGLAGRRFAGGDEPNLADLAAFGVIRAVRQTGAFRDLMANSRLAPWFDAMEEVVGGSARVESA